MINFTTNPSEDFNQILECAFDDILGYWDNDEERADFLFDGDSSRIYQFSGLGRATGPVRIRHSRRQPFLYCGSFIRDPKSEPLSPSYPPFNLNPSTLINPPTIHNGTGIYTHLATYHLKIYKIWKTN